VVVAISGLDHITPCVEWHAHLSQIVAQGATERSAPGGIVPSRACPQEALAAFAHPRVVIDVGVVVQGPRESSQQRRAGFHAVCTSFMVRGPQLGETRISLRGQALHARVLEQRDERDLRGFERSDLKPRGAELQMRRDMGARGNRILLEIARDTEGQRSRKPQIRAHEARSGRAGLATDLGE